MNDVCYSQLGYNIRILDLQIVIDRFEAFFVKNIECFPQLKIFYVLFGTRNSMKYLYFLSKINQSMPVCYSKLVYNICQLNLQMVKAFLWMFTHFTYYMY